MQAIFVELSFFQKYRAEYLSDDAYLRLQEALLIQPDLGELIRGTGGLRKLRFADKRRNKGKRGGLRVIYYYWVKGRQFWMFTLYDKDEMSDLSSAECKAFSKMLEWEISQRNTK